MEEAFSPLPKKVTITSTLDKTLPVFRHLATKGSIKVDRDKYKSVNKILQRLPKNSYRIHASYVIKMNGELSLSKARLKKGRYKVFNIEFEGIV